jgi:tetratricopeptide (TPR) repeat protein
LGQKFLEVNLYAWALKTYEKGKTLGKDGQTYSFEIAGVQGSLGNFQGMCEAYMDILKEQPSYIGQVETSLMQLVDFQDDDERCNDLKALVLKRIQIEPSTTIYSEFLAWFLMQRRDFNGAFIQLNALDKRNNENGNRLMNLAIQAGNNEEYSVANKCYSAVIAKGKSSVFFQQASVKKLQTLSLLLKQNEFATNEEFLALDTEYATIQNEIVLANELAILKKDWAHLKTFFLNNSKDAEVLLKEALDLGGVNGMTIAEIKLELGDVLLFQNKIWEASLLFSQIELDFKDDVLGHEAKFRNAKISFYTGDFEWAQGQLDVLKASTSKLISNNALQLSLLITDNFNMDTIPLPMMQYARAELLAYQNQFALAFQTLDSITTAFPGHSLTDEILFTKANIYRKQGDFEKAVLLFTELVNIHFEGIYADDALFALAEIEEKHFKDLAKAQTHYERLLNDFPGSLFVIDARKRYRALKGEVQ